MRFISTMQEKAFLAKYHITLFQTYVDHRIHCYHTCTFILKIHNSVSIVTFMWNLTDHTILTNACFWYCVTGTSLNAFSFKLAHIHIYYAGPFLMVRIPFESMSVGHRMAEPFCSLLGYFIGRLHIIYSFPIASFNSSEHPPQRPRMIHSQS